MPVVGTEKVIRSLNDLPRRLKRRIQDSLETSAAEMMGLATIKIQTGSKGGRAYSRGKRVHVASKPGRYPNADFGELVRSLFWEKRGDLQAVWGASAKHAKPLELGTSRMAARPFLRPTFLALQSKASSRVMTAVTAAVNENFYGR